MSLLSAERVAAPRYRTVPPAATSAGQEAVELAASAGLVLDPWQAADLCDFLGETPDGRWAAFECGLIVPRQNGKGGVLEARELAGLFLFGEDLIIHSAHEFKTAQEAFRRVLGLIQSTRDLEKRVMRVRTSHGEEGVELRSGQRLRFVARSGGSGRGFSGDCVILDEAYRLAMAALAALFPTMSARPNPQLYYTSSAPLPIEDSTVLRRLCKRGRAGGSERLAYIEYSAEGVASLDDPASLDSPEAVEAANPALGIRISMDFVRSERQAMDDEAYGRERLGLWLDSDERAQWAVPAEDWALCESTRSGPVGQVAFALDVSPNRSSSAIAVAAGSGLGGTHVEVTSDEDGVVDHRQGTDWVVERAASLQKRWGGAVAVAQGSPADSLRTALVDAGLVEGETLLVVPTADHAKACGSLYDAAVEHTLRHLGQPGLTAAVAGAATRPYGDAWLWSRRHSSSDITPLVAATLAKWALENGEGPSVYEGRGMLTI